MHVWCSWKRGLGNCLCSRPEEAQVKLAQYLGLMFRTYTSEEVVTKRVSLPKDWIAGALSFT